MKTLSKNIYKELDLIKGQYGFNIPNDLEPVFISGQLGGSGLEIEQKHSGIPIVMTKFNAENLTFDYLSIENSVLQNVNVEDTFLISESEIAKNKFINIRADELSIEQTKINASRFEEIYTSNSFFDGVTIKDSEFEFCDLKQSNWNSVKIKDSSFKQVELSKAAFSKVEFENVYFENVDFNKIAEFKQVSFKECKFKDCQIDRQKMLENDINFDEHSLKGTNNSMGLQPKEERFKQFLNQMSVFQEGAYTDADIEVLKATYDDEQVYEVVFQSKSDEQLYKASYCSGHFIKLQPENEKIENSLNTFNHHPQNILTDIDKTHIFSITNDVTRQMEQFKSMLQDAGETKLSNENAFDNKFNAAIEQENPVNKINALMDVKQNIREALSISKQLDQLHETVYPYVEKVLNSSLREGTENAVSVELKPFTVYEKGKETFNDHIKKIDRLSSDVINLELQNVRAKGIEKMLGDSLFKNTDQIIMMANFDKEKPFNNAVSDNLKKFNGINNYMGELVENQIKEPQKIIQHYVKISNSCLDYLQMNYTDVNKSKVFEYAKDSLDKAKAVLDKELSKGKDSYKPLVFSIQTNDELKNVGINLKAVTLLKANEEITFEKVIGNPNINDKQKEYWEGQLSQQIEKSDKKIETVQEIER